MNRRGFLVSLIAAAAAPLVPRTPFTPLRPHTTGTFALTSISINGKVVATFDPPKQLIGGETLRITHDHPEPPFRWYSYDVVMREQ